MNVHTTIALACAASLASSASAGPPPPPPGPVVVTDVIWEKSDGGNGHLYMVIHDARGPRWDLASNEARRMGGSLVSILSEAENAFVYSLVDDVPEVWNTHVVVSAEGTEITVTFGPWLGGRQTSGPEPAGGWTWSTGERWEYTNWREGEPNNLGNENSLHFFGEFGPEPVWNDRRNVATDAGVVGQPVVTGYIVEITGRCGIADLAMVIGVYDVNDVLTFSNAFGAGEPLADLFPPGAGDGLFDINDVLTFAAAFGAECE